MKFRSERPQSQRKISSLIGVAMFLLHRVKGQGFSNMRMRHRSALHQRARDADRWSIRDDRSTIQKERSGIKRGRRSQVPIFVHNTLPYLLRVWVRQPNRTPQVLLGVQLALIHHLLNQARISPSVNQTPIVSSSSSHVDDSYSSPQVPSRSFYHTTTPVAPTAAVSQPVTPPASVSKQASPVSYCSQQPSAPLSRHHVLNPLVRAGLVPVHLADILSPQANNVAEKHITRVRVLT